jgi:serine/threonine protein kinase
MPLVGGAGFAGYTIVRRLGSGGMGEVYLAQHPRLPRRDALKLLARDVSADESFRERFLREADLASTLWHPHIVGVHDRGEYDDQLWISMDFVDGHDAGHLLAARYAKGMPIELVVEIVAATASGLDYAHNQGLLHRDVKPANIMLTHLDEKTERRILLTDFGIARMVDDISGLTATNFTVGTVAYTAPEQLTGEQLDGRADQYSLAATAYHLLSGAPLFEHSYAAVVIGRHLQTPPPPLASVRPELAPLDAALAIALAKNPAERFDRCSDFATAFAEAARGKPNASGPESTAQAPTQVAAKPPLTVGAPSKLLAIGKERSDAGDNRPTHRRTVIAVSAAAAVVLAAAATIGWLTRGHERPAPPTAAGPTATTNAAAAPSGSTPVSVAPPPPPATFATAAIDTLMLSPTQIRSLTGNVFSGISPTEDMVVTKSSYGMSDNTAKVQPPSCVGVLYGAEHAVYGGSAFQEIRDQTLDPSNYTSGNQLEQTAVVFPTAEDAQASWAAQTKQWQSCTNLPSDVAGMTGLQMGQRNGEGGYAWTLSSVKVSSDMISMGMAGYDNEAGSDRACQQALGIKANVLVKVAACQGVQTNQTVFQDTSAAGTYAARLAQVILEKITV